MAIDDKIQLRILHAAEKYRSSSLLYNQFRNYTGWEKEMVDSGLLKVRVSKRGRSFIVTDSGRMKLIELRKTYGEAKSQRRRQVNKNIGQTRESVLELIESKGGLYEPTREELIGISVLPISEFIKDQDVVSKYAEYVSDTLTETVQKTRELYQTRLFFAYDNLILPKETSTAMIRKVLYRLSYFENKPPALRMVVHSNAEMTWKDSFWVPNEAGIKRLLSAQELPKENDLYNSIPPHVWQRKATVPA